MKQLLQHRLHISLLLPLYFLAFLPRLTSRELLVALSLFMICNWILLFNKTTDLAEDIHESSLPIDQAHIGIIKQLAYICLIISLLLLLKMPEILAIFLFFGGLLGFIYSYPIRIGGKNFRLKNIFLVKNLSAAVIWTGLTCMPFYFLFPDFPRMLIFLKVISAFFLSVFLEIMIDIRDTEGDRQAGIMTLPNTLGIARTKTIAFCILTGYCLWYYHLSPYNPRLFLLLIFTQIFLSLFALFANEKRPYWYFHLPALMGIAFSLYILCSWYT